MPLPWEEYQSQKRVAASPIGPFPGMKAQGNIDLAARPIVRNSDGSISTVRSMSFGTDGGEILVPTVSPDGRIMSDDEAVQQYGKTGQQLGVFDTPEHADMYAQALHKAQDRFYQAQEQRKPWEDFKSDGTADAAARAQAGVARAKAIRNGASRETPIDPNTGQPVGVPAFSPQNYGMGGSAAMGAANSTTFGFGDELASVLGSALTGVPRKQVLQEMRADDAKAQADNPGSYLAGQIGGGLAQGVATGGAGFGANAAKAGGGLGKVALGTALDSGIYGGLLGAGNANGDLKDRAIGGGSGALIGGAVGFGAPYLAAGITKGAQKLVSPFASSPEREAAVNVLAQEGVPVTAGQRTGSNALRYAESELGGNKAANMMENQAEAFTNAAMQKAGGSGRATPDNLAALKGNLGQQFDDLASRNTMVADRQLAQDMGKTLNRYGKLLETQQKPIINNLVDDIVQRVRANNGTLSGPEYQTIRSDLSQAAQSTTNQTLKSAFKGLRDSLDDAMERSINPADLGAWKVLRKQYGNYKVVERASTGGTADAGLGLINPAQLRVAASTGNRGGFATGGSDFTDLAKAGQAVLTPLPNSGTASRISARSLGAFAPTVIGAGYGGASGGDLKSAAAGAAAGYALQKGAGAALMNPLIQRYLGNQAAATGASPATQAYIAALLRSAGLPAIEGR
ncbi:MAG: hypothetical protein E5X94_00585 [Mesorhizobium sp.]|uniref:hypothetical protein n=1 Tax=Mesorhizobium sp. TaxID=1871066 RepID=UPI0011F555F5|nr:hypothetical protein [Mesorhizobium sp.]TIN82748.1 MAG: hypothetical protein E5X97_29010 [Mesorhizobium sp.]TIN88335.1 MAG: hypothetical protein E5X94_00585 [Mesorhizobium sp.]